MSTQESEKLQKILARAGFGSRRSVEPLIEEGLVKVNGRVASLGDRATSQDRITVRDRLVKESRLERQPTQVLLYNKPEGLVCTRNDEKGRDNIFQQLPKLHHGRWIAIGRLDLNTSGLMILTNNGELANRMMHPSYQIEREYTVRVFGQVEPETIKLLQKGVMLEDGIGRFTKVIKMQKHDDESINSWYRVGIKEGRYREVRRMWESQGHKVSRLHRIRYGSFSLPANLRRGKTHALSWKQVNELLRSVELPEEARPDIRSQQGNVKTTKRQADAMNRHFKGKVKTIHDLSEGKGRAGRHKKSR